MDRASGSGVFARDPDALLDMVQLAVGEGLAGTRTAWRIEGTLREFAPFPPVDVWFDYPVHKHDTEDILFGAKPQDEVLPHERGTEANAAKNDERAQKRNEELRKAYEKAAKKGPVRIGALVKLLGKSDRTVSSWIGMCPFLDKDRDGYIFEISEDEPPCEFT